MVLTFGLNWWSTALRGAIAVICGLIAFLMPAVTLFAIAILFGGYALLDGIVSLSAALRSHRHGERWWALLIEGIAGVGAAVVTMFWPAVTVAVLVFIVAAWAIITGILEIMTAVRLRRYIAGEWILVLAGLASIIFGVLLFAMPAAGAVVLAWWIGAYILAFGLLMLGLAFRLRQSYPASLRPQHA